MNKVNENDRGKFRIWMNEYFIALNSTVFIEIFFIEIHDEHNIVSDRIIDSQLYYFELTTTCDGPQRRWRRNDIV